MILVIRVSLHSKILNLQTLATLSDELCFPALLKNLASIRFNVDFFSATLSRMLYSLWPILIGLSRISSTFSRYKLLSYALALSFILISFKARSFSSISRGSLATGHCTVSRPSTCLKLFLGLNYRNDVG